MPETNGMLELTDEQVVQAFMDLLNRFDGVFAKGEDLRYWDIGDDDEETPAEAESAVEIYLAKRTAARMVFNADGSLKDIDPIDF